MNANNVNQPGAASGAFRAPVPEGDAGAAAGLDHAP